MRFCDYYFSFLELLLLFISIRLEDKKRKVCFLLASMITLLSLFIKFTAGAATVGSLFLCILYYKYHRWSIRFPLLITVIIMPLLFVGLYLLYNYSYVSLYNYIVAAQQISSGFNSAMTMPVESVAILWAGLGSILFIWLGYFAYQKQEFSLWVLLSALVFTSYKHGIVRGDHIFWFVGGLFLCSSLYVFFMNYTIHFQLIKLNPIKTLFLGFLLVGMTLFPLLHWNFSIDNIIKSQYNRYHYFFQYAIGCKDDKIDCRNKLLSTEFINKIGNKNFTVYPWEIAYGYSYNNFKMMPIFQQYQAYTTYLDNLNASFLKGKEIEYIVFNMDTLDERIPLIDTPSSWAEIYKNYDIVDYDGHDFLLQKTEKNISDMFFSEAEYNKNEKIYIPKSEQHISISLHSNLNIFGRLAKIFYKIPRIYMELELDDGELIKRQVLFETLENETLIDVLPQNDMDFYNFMMGEEKVHKVRSIRFLGDGLRFFEDRIKIDYRSISIDSKSNRIQTSIYSNVILHAKGKNMLNNMEASLDMINRQGFKDGIDIKDRFIRIHGWGTTKEHTDIFKSIYLMIDDDLYNTRVLERQDVVNYFHNPLLLKSGFVCMIDCLNILPGKHHIALVGMDKDGNYYKKDFGEINLEKL